MMNKLFKKAANNVIANGGKKEGKSFFSPSFAVGSVAGTAASWSASSFSAFAANYMSNIIAYRCVLMIARNASYVPFKLFQKLQDIQLQDNQDDFYENSQSQNSLNKNNFVEILQSPILDIFKKPNIHEGYSSFMEKVYSSLLISGNAFVLFEKNKQNDVVSMKVLRADRVSILTNNNGDIVYRYKHSDASFVDYSKNASGQCCVMHIKNYNPLNEFYGFSPFDVAKYAIEQHNESSNFNKALLQNFARPSGALVIQATEYNKEAMLTQDQFDRLKEQIEYNFSKTNAGRPMLLEGGMDWKEMSMSPKDMDFLETRNGCAREIALAFGVPPQLLGIPGDNTYSNMEQAHLALWEQTIIPFINFVANSFEDYFKTNTGSDFDIRINQDEISTLSSNRQTQWDRISSVDFLTINEKRKLVGFSPIKNGDVLSLQSLQNNQASFANGNIDDGSIIAKSKKANNVVDDAITQELASNVESIA